MIPTFDSPPEGAWTLRRAIAATPAGRMLLAREGCIVIGEVAQAHDGSLGLAHAFVDAIAAAGADGVKFQTHIAAAESTPSEPWRVRFSPQDASRFEYWQRMEFTADQWDGLKRHAEERGLLFLSSPFSVEAVELLARLQVGAWKVASGEIGNLAMLDAVRTHPVPVLVSTGMSGTGEIDAAVARLLADGIPSAVLQCTSQYPCPPEKVGLNLLPLFRERYGFTGLSDHSGTPYPAFAAAVIGADVVELHVTLSREMFGPDVCASVTTSELADLVRGIRWVDAMRRAPVDKDTVGAELAPMRRLFTKSVVARIPLEAGTVLRPEHLAAKKPGTGVPAARLPQLVGARLRRAIRADELVLEADLEECR
jgi:N-acetylneuraminate synthase